MWCPKCKAAETKVLDSRLVMASNYTRRRRACQVCKYRFTTHEYVELRLPRVIKRDGNKYQFQEDKIRLGVMRALEKRPVSQDVLEDLVVQIINRVCQHTDGEIASEQIGIIVLEELKKIDEVAYVRFASVYQSFTNIESFQKVVLDLQKRKGKESDTENNYEQVSEQGELNEQ